MRTVRCISGGHPACRFGLGCISLAEHLSWRPFKGLQMELLRWLKPVSPAPRSTLVLLVSIGSQVLRWERAALVSTVR